MNSVSICFIITIFVGESIVFGPYMIKTYKNSERELTEDNMPVTSTFDLMS